MILILYRAVTKHRRIKEHTSTQQKYVVTKCLYKNECCNLRSNLRIYTYNEDLEQNILLWNISMIIDLNL